MVSWEGVVVVVGRSVMQGGVKLEGVGSKEVRRSEEVVALEEVVACVIRRLFCREAALLLGLAEEWGLGGGLVLVSPW